MFYQENKESSLTGADNGLPVQVRAEEKHDLSEVKLPPKYFENEIGVEDIPSVVEVEPDRSVDFKSAEVSPLPALETDAYKILNHEDGRVSNIIIKSDPQIEISFNESIDPKLIPNVCSNVSETLKFLKNNSLVLPEGKAEYKNMGAIIYQAKDQSGNDSSFLASPSFYGEKDKENKISPNSVKRITSLKEEISKLEESSPTKLSKAELENKLDELNMKEKQLVARSENLKEVRTSYAKPVFKQKADAEEYEKLSLELKTLEKQDSINYQVARLQDDLSYQERIASTQTSYTGQFRDMDSISLINNEESGKIGVYSGDKKVGIIGVSNHRYQVLGEGAVPMLEFEDHSEKNIIKYHYADSRMRENLCKEEIDLNGEVVTRERYSLKGEIFSREYENLGVIQTFKDGKFDEWVIEDEMKFFENIKSCAELEKFDQLLDLAAKDHSNRFLYNISKIESNRLLELGELAISKLSSEELRPLNFNRISKSEDNSRSFNAVESELQEILEFRKTMMNDARILVESSLIEGQDVRMLSLWNDPKSRGYFGIKDEWLELKNLDGSEVKWKAETMVERMDMKLSVARRLYDSKMDINEENVQSVLADIIETRDKVGLINVVENRNVVMAAHSDTYIDSFDAAQYKWHEDTGDYHQFGKASLVRDIIDKQNGSGTFKLIRAETDILPSMEDVRGILEKKGLNKETIDEIVSELVAIKEIKGRKPELIDLMKSIEDRNTDFEIQKEVLLEIRGEVENLSQAVMEKKEEFLNAIATTPPPMTVIFDGHGGPDALYLSDGLIGADKVPVEFDTTIKITSEEFAKAFEERKENFGSSLDANNPDIVILQSCYSANFTQRLSSLIPKENMPIMIGANEFNQYSYYLMSNPHGSTFLSDVVGLKKGETSTIGDIFKRQHRPIIIQGHREDGDVDRVDLRTNPVIKVPDEDGKPVQVGAVGSPASDLI